MKKMKMLMVTVFAFCMSACALDPEGEQIEPQAVDEDLASPSSDYLASAKVQDTQSEVPAELSEPEQTEAQVGPDQTAESVPTLTAWYCVTGACAQFEAYGDHLYVKDTVADGHSAVGEIYGYGTCWNHYGAGTTADCNFDTAESTIYFRACTGEYSTKQLLTCTSWIQTSAAN